MTDVDTVGESETNWNGSEFNLGMESGFSLFGEQHISELDKFTMG